MKNLKSLSKIFLFVLLNNYSLFAQNKLSNSIKNSGSVVGFIENKGQIIDQNNLANPSVKYLLNLSGLNIQLKANSFSYDTYIPEIIEKPKPEKSIKFEKTRPAAINFKYHRVDISFVNANENPIIITKGQSEDYINYYTTGTTEAGITHVKHYKTVTYKNLYPFIDLEFSSNPGTQKPVEYNFILHPGADISDIKWTYNGSFSSSLIDGNINIKTANGILNEKIPASYELETNKKITIAYKNLDNNGFGFDGNWDSKNTLIIDPLPILNWSTYYGGAVLDETDGVHVDATGNVVVTGETTSTTNIATSGAYQTTMNGGTIQYLWGGDAFIAKFSPSGSRIWATYFGGTGEDCGWSLKTDKNSDIFVTGDTKSTTGIATTGAFQTTNSTTYHDPFLAKFTSSGTRVWGTYFGGSGNDRATRNGMAIDASGNVYIVGTNNTANDMWITTLGAYQRTNGSTSAYDCPYVAKFNTNGGLVWGTYYGGPLHDQCYGIALDANNNVYITGATTSTTLIATTGAHQTALAGATDAFIAKLNSTGTALLWATYYGGSGKFTTVGNSIAVDPSGNVIISGYTTATSGIASSGAYKTTYMGGAYDGFLLKFSPTGTRIWGTYTGGTLDDIPRSMLVTPSGDILTIMQTSSTSGLTTSDGLVTGYIGGTYDACIQKYTTSGVLKLGSYLGGNLEDIPWHMDMDTKNNIYTVGRTTSTLYISTTGSYQVAFGGGTYDGVLSKFQDVIADMSIESVTFNPSPVCSNKESDVTIKVKNNGPIPAIQMGIGIDLVGQARILSSLNLNNLAVGKDTTITILKLFKSNISGTNLKINCLQTPGDLNTTNDTFKTNITVRPSPSGSNLIKGSPFKTTQYNTMGTLLNPDIVAERDTLTYEITVPKNYSNSNYGSNWLINSTILRTKGGRSLPTSYFKLITPISGSNAKIFILPDNAITDTALILLVSLIDLGIGNCDSVLVRNIFVAPRPKTDFTFNTPVCFGDNVVFTNKTTITSGNFTSHWDFGTGNPADTSNNSDVVFKFPSSGTFKVSLTALSYPYSYVETKIYNVVVSEIPNIGFKVLNACFGDSVSFINTTTISKGSIDYKWDFGNGKTSIKVNPKEKYNKAGGYKVTLTATSNKCMATITKNAQQFARPIAGFIAPSSLCDKTDIRFINLSTITIGNMGYKWDFGDGIISGYTDPYHKFDLPGTKTIKMRAMSEFGCADSITKNITLSEAPLANFTTGPVCNLSATNFIFTGSKPAGNLTNFNWDFNGESSTTVENPSKLFDIIGNKIITLRLTSNNGCTDYITKEINVKLQSKANFEVKDVCDGEDVVFTNSSSVSAGNLVYNWKFGDGTTSNSLSPRHRYSFGSSTYNVTLVAIVPGGCSDSISKPVSINSMPISGFTFKTSGRLVYFNSSQAGNTYYHWTFGDGGTSENAITQYHYNNSFGYGKFKACLTTVNAGGCFSQSCKDILITGGIENLNSNSGIKIYPNPNYGQFVVDIETPQDNLSIEIYNLQGALIKTVDANSLISHYNIQLHASQGIYIVKIINGQQITNHKVTINK